MCNIGDIIRAAIVEALEGRLSGPEMEEFKTWLADGDVPKYYFDRLLDLKAVANDLSTISDQWRRPVNEHALDVLCKISDAQGIVKQINDKFLNFETFLQYKDAEIEASFAGLGV